MERWHARGHIVFRISPSRFSGSRSEEKRRIGKEKDEDEKTSGFTSGSCREKAGSLNHAATTTGLQKQTPHLLCCLLPQPTPCCYYVCLYAGLSVHAHRQALRQAVRGGRAFEPLERKGRYIRRISACGYRDKAWPYLSILTKDDK